MWEDSARAQNPGEYGREGHKNAPSPRYAARNERDSTAKEKTERRKKLGNRWKE